MSEQNWFKAFNYDLPPFFLSFVPNPVWIRLYKWRLWPICTRLCFYKLSIYFACTPWCIKNRLSRSHRLSVSLNHVIKRRENIPVPLNSVSSAHLTPTWWLHKAWDVPKWLLNLTFFVQTYIMIKFIVVIVLITTLKSKRWFFRVVYWCCNIVDRRCWLDWLLYTWCNYFFHYYVQLL